jgi:hypothetical protein
MEPTDYIDSITVRLLTGVHHMLGSYSNTAGLALTAIERPRCSNCDARMSLARIAPGPSGFDIRTFECGGCHHVHIVTGVETDPMRSDAVRWLAGNDLRSPT